MRAFVLLLVLALGALPPFAVARQFDAHVDLVVVDVFSEPRRPLAGEEYRLVAVVRNAGPAALQRSVVVEFWADDVWIGDARISATRTSPLGASAEVIAESPNALRSAVGFVTIRGVIDVRDAVVETDETNNEAWGKVPISTLIVAFSNPQPGEPYAERRALTLPTTYDEVWSVLDCSSATTLALYGPYRSGALVHACVGVQPQGADTYALLPGDYVLEFVTDRGTGAALYGVPHPYVDPGPRE